MELVFIVRDQEVGGSNPLAPTTYIPLLQILSVEAASFDCAKPLLIWATFWATPVQVWTRLLKTHYESTTKKALEATLPGPFNCMPSMFVS
jgi:hypothetical protein